MPGATMERKHVEFLNNNYLHIKLSNSLFLSTPLHFAAANGYLNIVWKLVEYNADIDIEDDSGYTAYDIAVQFDQMDIADYLASL